MIAWLNAHPTTLILCLVAAIFATWGAVRLALWKIDRDEVDREVNDD